MNRAVEQPRTPPPELIVVNSGPCSESIAAGMSWMIELASHCHTSFSCTLRQSFGIYCLSPVTFIAKMIKQFVELAFSEVVEA